MDVNCLVKKILNTVAHGDRKYALTLLYRLINDCRLTDKSKLSVARIAIMLGEFSIGKYLASSYISSEETFKDKIIEALSLLAECGDYTSALNYIQTKKYIENQTTKILHFTGTILQQLGQYKIAEKYLVKALDACDSLNGPTWLTLSAQIDFSNNELFFEKIINSENKIKKLNNEYQASYFYALGKALLDRNQFDSAFNKFNVASKLSNKLVPIKKQNEAEYIDKLILNYADNTFLPDFQEVSVPKNPIFIIGLPRSGTTLLEQILVTHNEINTGGEFGGIRIATLHLGKASDISSQRIKQLNSTNTKLRTITQIYTHVTKERFNSYCGIVDKSINNIYYLGIIAAAFPKSPIIMIKRNPADVAWSCFRTCFNQGMAWSNSLHDIAEHFNNIDRLTTHWLNLIGNRVLEVSYENLIVDPLKEISAILMACGLEMDNNVLRFYENNRVITTSSTVQVRKPLYTSSIASHESVAHRMHDFFNVYKG
ncbi:sulfotransferase [Microbulbifer sp. TYP-18]|uniref:sulfotransferase family protein n=1 Tax=Microbulbifer sp. TYP-18 TaxID=3230024 RepID=UPI0034C66382